MDDRIKKLLSGEKSVLSSNKNAQMDINIESKTRPISENIMSETISQNTQFELERSESNIYRFYGNIKSLVSNVLFNDNLKIYQRDEKDDEGNIIEDRQGNPVKITNSEKTDANQVIEVDGWFGYFDDDAETAQEYVRDANNYNDNKSSLCELIHFSPGPNRLRFDDSDGQQNYMLKITYPHETQDIELVNNTSGVSLKDGINIIGVEERVMNERSYSSFRCVINHGLKKGDIITLYKSGNLSGEEYLVVELGDQTNNQRDRYFVLDIPVNESSSQINKETSTFKRTRDGVTSNYYVRKFKSITTGFKDYDLFPASFAESYFGDEEVAYNFTKDIDVSGLKDNLGRPLSELFLTIVKVDTDTSNDFKDQYWKDLTKNNTNIPTDIRDRFWTKIKGGFLTENDTSVNYNVRSISSDGGTYPQTHFGSVDNGIDESDNEFIGDISEYNSIELSERIIEPIYHRINTIYREYRKDIVNLKTTNDGGFEVDDLREGYIYRPHYRIKIREFASYIETGDESQVIGIPDYATIDYQYEDKNGDDVNVYKWRDLLDVGFYDETGRGLDYPFKSGAHYMYLDLRFFLQRQDPPFRVYENEIDLTLNQDEELFEYIVKSPNYVSFRLNQNSLNLPDVINVDVPNAASVAVTISESDGEYPLGDRLINGEDLEVPNIVTIRLNDVC
jgi:hypothetical protein